MQQTEEDHDGLAPTIQHSLLGEFWDFLMQNRNWWMLPIAAVLGLIGLLITLAGTGAAPFIYTLF